MDWSLNELMRFSQNLFLSAVDSVGNISSQEVKISIAVKRLVFFFPERVNVNCKQWFILPIFTENCCKIEIITLGLHILLPFKWSATHETFLALISSMSLTFSYYVFTWMNLTPEIIMSKDISNTQNNRNVYTSDTFKTFSWLLLAMI